MDSMGLRILIIDDDPTVHQTFIKILINNEYPTTSLYTIDNNPSPHQPFRLDTVLASRDGLTKIKQARLKNKSYALAFINITPPTNQTNLDIVRKIGIIDPTIQIVLCHNDDEYQLTTALKSLGINDNLLILRKPFDGIAIRQLAYVLTRKWLLTQDSERHFSVLKTINSYTLPLQKALILLKSAADSSADGILFLNLNNNPVYYNQKVIDIFNIPLSIITSHDSNALILYMAQQLESTTDFLKTLSYTKNTNKKTNFLAKLTINDKKTLECHSRLHYVNTAVIGRVWRFHDVSYHISLQEKLAYQATHDLLTELPNRLLLNDRIQQAINHATRYKKRIAILFIDIDHFKLINDSLSHQVGDDLLHAVARRLSLIIRQEDTLARVGGDEFISVIPALNHNQDVISIAKKIVHAFREPFQLNLHKLTVTASIGISLYPDDGITVEALLRNADLAMYQSKNQGGNQFKFYTIKLNHQSQEQLE